LKVKSGFAARAIALALGEGRLRGVRAAEKSKSIKTTKDGHKEFPAQ
jgi:hypothetical protein